MPKNVKKFNIRAFVATMVTLSGIGLPVTGVLNHYLGFDSLTLARHAWMSAHNLLGVLFVLFGIWHSVMNRRALWNYLKGAAARIPTISREAVMACALVSFLLFLFVGHAFHAGH